MGNFDFALLASYSKAIPRRTLGEIVAALGSDPVVDPMFGLSLSQNDLTDHVAESNLNDEEVRINRANKLFHRVYNRMPFPDRLDRPARTITATCTRVSRESIVIPSSADSCRRLTIRERASVQGFPIAFQFHGETHAQKLRMVGNAIPPLFTFFMAQAFQGIPATATLDVANAAKKLALPVQRASTKPYGSPAIRYMSRRRFRFVVPSLHLRSGVRFEFCNDFELGAPSWRMAFYYGTSKSIRSINLDQDLRSRLLRMLPPLLKVQLIKPLTILRDFVREADIAHMQRPLVPSGTRNDSPIHDA